MRLSLYLGDSPTFAIPLTLAGQPFVPGTEWGLIFTLKYDEDDNDEDAIFQKASGVGIDVVGSKAYVTPVGGDTKNLRPFTGVWDIRAQSSITGKRHVVANDIFTAKRPVTESDQTSKPIHTTEVPAPFAGGDVDLPDWMEEFDSIVINADNELELTRGGETYLSPLTLKVQRRLFSGRNSFPTEVYSHATNKSATFRKRVAIFGDVEDIVALFVNSYVAVNGEVSLPYPITISARIVINGVATQFLFGGATSKTLAPGELAKTDPLARLVDSVTMTIAYIDVYVVTSGQDITKLWPTNYPLYNEWGDGVTYGSDLTAPSAAAPATVALGADVKGYSPVALIGKRASGGPSVALFGDSINYGRGDNSGFDANTLYGREDFGFVKRALNAAKVAFVSFAKSGDTYEGVTTEGNRPLMKRLVPLCGCEVAIDTYGLNDITAGKNVAALKTMSSGFWTSLRSMGIARIWITTKTFKTTSTDHWRTTTNQTAAAGYEPGGVREMFNAWIRSGSDGLVEGYFEVADTVESARNSGKWAAATVGTSHSVTSSTSTTLTVTGAGWTAKQWQDYCVLITSGTGYPQNDGGNPREIMSNTTTSLTLIPAQGFSPAIGVATGFQFVKSMTADGTHPSSAGMKLMAAAIDTAQL